MRLHLRACAEAYAATRKIGLTTVGRIAAGDWRFFTKLQNGETTFTARKYDDVISWFSVNWPVDAAWPAEVRRPVVTASAPQAAE